jgi:phosphoketolase
LTVHLRTDNKYPYSTDDSRAVLNVTERNGWQIIESTMSITNKEKPEELHERYGYLPYPVFKHMEEAPLNLRKILNDCDTCMMGKLKIKQPNTW